MENNTTCIECNEQLDHYITKDAKIKNKSIHKHHEKICNSCSQKTRIEYIENILEQEKGELSSLETEVLKSLEEQEILSKNINLDLDHEVSFGDRVADKVASFGGSWKFIISFFLILIGWIIINTFLLTKTPFDPYPFILLNLVLSCLAALQAPIIMMSQNRQEAKDRLRSEHDYKVNLKAELEIRHLNDKVDYLISKQWQRLIEIQKMQMEIMTESMERKKRNQQQ